MTPGDWLGLTFIAVGFIGRHLNSGVDDDAATRYVRWYRNLGPVGQACCDALLLGIGAFWVKLYVDGVLVPRLAAGPIQATILVVFSLFGVGLGLSAGKAVTERDYDMFRHPDSRGQAMVDPLPVGLLIIVAVAALVLGNVLQAWPAELERASEAVVTPCYYFCGPWYTWLPVIFIGIVVVVGAIGYLQQYLPRSDRDE